MRGPGLGGYRDGVGGAWKGCLGPELKGSALTLTFTPVVTTDYGASTRELLKMTILAHMCIWAIP